MNDQTYRPAPKKSLVVSLIGRPNVGKSSLFNRLMGKQTKALAHDRPGVTRDRHYGLASFDKLTDIEEQEVILVDTGGFYPSQISSDAPLPSKMKKGSSGIQDKQAINYFFNIMREHAHLAMEESDLVVLVTDSREGLLPFDEAIANEVRAAGKPLWVVVNKMDSDKQAGQEGEFYSLLGPEGELFSVSAAHGLGVEDFQESVQRFAALSNGKGQKFSGLKEGVVPREKVVGRLAIIGSPNAGKSTLLNQMVGGQRALVSSIAGTTVDPIEAYFDVYVGQDAGLLDEKWSGRREDHLFQEYENLRVNHPEVFHRIRVNYELEEGRRDTHLILGNDENYEDEAQEEFAEDSDERTKELVEQLEGPVEEIEETPQETSITDPDVERQSYWRSLHIVDTAGIRKRTSIKDAVEAQSVYRALRCIAEADIVLHVIDAPNKGLSHQDRRLIDIALEKGKSVIVAMNKWDIMAKNLTSSKEREEWVKDLRAHYPWLDFVDLVPISAKRGNGLSKLKKTILDTLWARRRPIPTSDLNRVLCQAVEKHAFTLPRTGGKRLKLKYASMIKCTPPTVLMFTNGSKGLSPQYRRYLKNRLRDAFGLRNTPVHFMFRKGSEWVKTVESKEVSSEVNETRP